MKNMMAHQGYDGSVNYNDDDGVFYGKVEFIRDLVSYEGHDAQSLGKAFRDAVDDYLKLCETGGWAADLPFKGSFNVRTGSKLHRLADVRARAKGTDLNRIVSAALERYLDVP